MKSTQRPVAPGSINAFSVSGLFYQPATLFQDKIGKNYIADRENNYYRNKSFVNKMKDVKPEKNNTRLKEIPDTLAK